MTETTGEVSEHPHPRYKNFILWDLPGVGTPKFPRETYLKVTEFANYDFFLIITRSRFTENDLWLAKEVEESGKVFFLVRTHLDVDMRNQKIDYPRTYSEIRVIHTVRNNCEENLRKADIITKSIYALSGKMKHAARWDYPLLLSDLVSKSSGLQRHAMVLSLTASSRRMIEQKCQELKSEILKAAVGAGIGFAFIGNLGALASFFTTDSPEVSIFLHMVNIFKKQLQLDGEYLGRVSVEYSIPLSKLMAEVQPVMETTDMSIKLLSQSVRPRHTLEKILYAIPVVGNITSSVVVPYRMKKYLTKLLQDMKKAALNVQDLIEQVSKREI